MVHYAPFSECDDSLDASLFGVEPACPGVGPVTEFTAMETIGTAIAALTTDEARMRVLRWALEQFAPDLLQAREVAVQAAVRPDPTLSTEDLCELFERGTKAEEPPPAATHVEP